MRLAGQMRLTTFLTMAGITLAAVTVAGVAGGALYAVTRPDPPPHVPVPVEVHAPVTAPPVSAPAPVVTPAPSAEAPRGGRPVDAVVFGYRGKSIGSDKLKDVTQGQPYKVNVYQDAGQATANRAKIDLDRDDKWDEKITFEPDGVTRQVASADDESYDLTFQWDGSTWLPAP